MHTSSGRHPVLARHQDFPKKSRDLPDVPRLSRSVLQASLVRHEGGDEKCAQSLRYSNPYAHDKAHLCYATILLKYPYLQILFTIRCNIYNSPAPGTAFASAIRASTSRSIPLLKSCRIFFLLSAVGSLSSGQ